MASKRRGHGEGGVYRRQSDGKWVGSVTTGRTGEGKQRRRTVYGATKAEALAKLRELRNQHDAGTLAEPSSLTVAGFLGRWMDTVGKTKRESTQERRRVYVDKHINPFIGELRLTRLGLIHLESWLAELEKGGRSDWTRHQAATTLGTALKRAARMKLIPFSPPRTSSSRSPGRGRSRSTRKPRRGNSWRRALGTGCTQSMRWP